MTGAAFSAVTLQTWRRTNNKSAASNSRSVTSTVDTVVNANAPTVSITLDAGPSHYVALPSTNERNSNYLGEGADKSRQFVEKHIAQHCLRESAMPPKPSLVAPLFTAPSAENLTRAEKFKRFMDAACAKEISLRAKATVPSAPLAGNPSDMQYLRTGKRSSSNQQYTDQARAATMERYPTPTSVAHALMPTPHLLHAHAAAAANRLSQDSSITNYADLSTGSSSKWTKRSLGSPGSVSWSMFSPQNMAATPSKSHGDDADTLSAHSLGLSPLDMHVRNYGWSIFSPPDQSQKQHDHAHEHSSQPQQKDECSPRSPIEISPIHNTVDRLVQTNVATPNSKCTPDDHFTSKKSQRDDIVVVEEENNAGNEQMLLQSATSSSETADASDHEDVLLCHFPFPSEYEDILRSICWRDDDDFTASESSDAPGVAGERPQSGGIPMQVHTHNRSSDARSGTDSEEVQPYVDSYSGSSSSSSASAADTRMQYVVRPNADVPYSHDQHKSISNSGQSSGYHPVPFSTSRFGSSNVMSNSEGQGLHTPMHFNSRSESQNVNPFLNPPKDASVSEASLIEHANLLAMLDSPQPVGDPPRPAAAAAAANAKIEDIDWILNPSKKPRK